MVDDKCVNGQKRTSALSGYKTRPLDNHKELTNEKRQENSAACYAPNDKPRDDRSSGIFGDCTGERNCSGCSASSENQRIGNVKGGTRKDGGLANDAVRYDEVEALKKRLEILESQLYNNIGENDYDQKESHGRDIEETKEPLGNGHMGGLSEEKQTTQIPGKKWRKDLGAGSGLGGEKLPQKPQNDYRKTTAKLPQKPEVDESFFDDDDFDFAVDLYGKVSSKLWRIEKRFYEKQDGSITLSYNYRRRKGKKVKGKRVNVYKKGGSRQWRKSHTK